MWPYVGIYSLREWDIFRGTYVLDTRSRVLLWGKTAFFYFVFPSSENRSKETRFGERGKTIGRALMANFPVGLIDRYRPGHLAALTFSTGKRYFITVLYVYLYILYIIFERCGKMSYAGNILYYIIFNAHALVNNQCQPDLRGFF